MNRLSTFEAFKQITAGEGSRELSNDELARLKHVLVQMLVDIHDMCHEHTISYMLSYGSCLGAIRHNGFIPWDDDLDIVMARPDYNKFCDVFNKVLGEEYILQTPCGTSLYGLPFARIRKKGTLLKTRDDFFAKDGCGIYIDLFVLESLPENAALRSIHGLVSLCLGFGYSCRRSAWIKDYYLPLIGDNLGLRRVFMTKVIIGKMLSFASVDSWTRAWFKWNGICSNDCSTYVGVPVGRRKYFGEILKRSVVQPYSTSIFEGIGTYVPNDPDAYLCSIYGATYMELPPESEREKHIVFDFDDGTYAN